MDKLELFIAKVCEIISDKRYYYSQKRENEFATDCSDLICRSLKAAGIDIHGATYTGNMLTCLTKGPFIALKFDKTAAQRGDIFLRHDSGNQGHTVLYLGNNQIAEACNTKNGLRITPYYFNRYQYMLRYTETSQSAPDTLRTLKKGICSIEVGLVQLFLNKYTGTHLVIDCDFGPKTAEAVKNYQMRMKEKEKFFDMEIDGIVGRQTWSAIYFTMVTNS